MVRGTDGHWASMSGEIADELHGLETPQLDQRVRGARREQAIVGGDRDGQDLSSMTRTSSFRGSNESHDSAGSHVV